LRGRVETEWRESGERVERELREFERGERARTTTEKLREVERWGMERQEKWEGEMGGGGGKKIREMGGKAISYDMIKYT
jgi:hypothetical protein